MSKINIEYFKQALSRSKEYSITNNIHKYRETWIPPKVNDYDETYIDRIKIVGQDCIETLLNMTNDGINNILMLCMASDYHPGGGVKKGSSAQEEHICRCSTLYSNLMAIKSHKVYPIIKPFILPEVTFFSHCDTKQDGKLRNLKNDIMCSILMSAAVRKPKGSAFNKDDEIESYKRIKMMLEISIQYGYKNIILSAYGCGAFLNPPEIISKLFKRILIEEEYIKYFDNVTFSILDTSYSNNLSIFTKTFHD
ncbi:TIGR02452 family protein (DUF2263) [Orpheovirus IHUMI-LCC2]|uniref:TIGR02452 family protein (DUF2263) n=1 Tax=Orpheovirus IHUMI-LCC2 TaxID=2023057 RepID=A0A2I2L3Q3_9VIRU|nr:TIGR02452 family protein (DUF2263) [Orpheovirus IHUMI-LCC2]SNW62141.1 TIGR02452 family protein (DUF2263) [Orpheovirus IHUMI-LCC2]